MIGLGSDKKQENQNEYSAARLHGKTQTSGRRSLYLEKWNLPRFRGYKREHIEEIDLFQMYHYDRPLPSLVHILATHPMEPNWKDLKTLL